MRRRVCWRGVYSGTEAARLLVFVTLLATALLLSPAAGAQSFAQTFEPATCNAGALASDPVGDENPARIDAVGDATHAAALYANDASFYYMRLPDYLDDLADPLAPGRLILQGGRGVGCHVGVPGEGGPNGVLLLLLLLLLLGFGLGIRRYRRN